jgi:hypothetical protein
MSYPPLFNPKFNFRRHQIEALDPFLNNMSPVHVLSVYPFKTLLTLNCHLYVWMSLQCSHHLRIFLLKCCSLFSLLHFALFASSVPPLFILSRIITQATRSRRGNACRTTQSVGRHHRLKWAFDADVNFFSRGSFNSAFSIQTIQLRVRLVLFIFILINLKLLILFVHSPNVLSYVVLVTSSQLRLFICLFTSLH